MSCPSPRSFCKLVFEPGTLSMSASVQKITLSMLASLQASSMRLFGITHTGQPGPWMKFICSPTKLGSANFIMLCVWPPQISMIFRDFVLSFWMSFERARIKFLSRKSLIRSIKFSPRSYHQRSFDRPLSSQAQTAYRSFA